MKTARRILVAVVVVTAFTCTALAQTKRAINLDDLARLHEVADPQLSADGKWIAYTVSTVDKDADKRITHISLVSWDGAQHLPVTYGSESTSSPRFSPDGQYLAFTSGRPGETKGSQIWLLDRRGGEAHQLTHFKDYDISSYEWSPDSKKLVLILKEKEDADKEAKPAPNTAPNTPAPAKPPKPIVIDRYHFKQDIEGYLSGNKHNHIYLFDVATAKLDPITTGNFDDENAVFSPDGSKIAFVSNHDQDPDRSQNTDVFVVDARPGATARKLTTWPGPDGGKIVWSPDSKLIAYLQGDELKYEAYDMARLAVVPADGGAPRVLTQKLDRGVSDPQFTPDGKSLLFLVADDRYEYPAEISISGGDLEHLVKQPAVVSSINARGGNIALLSASDAAPNEVFALEDGGLRKLTSENDVLFSELQLGGVSNIEFKSKDGTDVHGLVTKPANYVSGQKYPTLLRIHGGPNGQDEHAFSFERQFFAANGYVVVNVNYRGSAGRGQTYQRSIWADWGNHEVADLLASMDHVVSTGVADPNRLGIGGWSYGGILTDYTIASDPRFKAAISGAGSANQLTMYGVDEYVRQYDNEIGPPWKNPAGWMKISYDFFHADRIHTPTLFMGGDKDFNVPLVGGEQMYEALRSLGVPTELVIYPGEFHGFKRPSFIRDRYERYLAWYNRYLKPGAAAPSKSAGD
ncbi:MAG: S9 family peptidase [Acidobacteriaceae bacterium]